MCSTRQLTHLQAVERHESNTPTAGLIEQADEFQTNCVIVDDDLPVAEAKRHAQAGDKGAVVLRELAQGKGAVQTMYVSCA